MATETEVERMVVRLLGDATSYAKMMTEASAATKRLTADVDTSSAKIGALAGSLSGYAGQVVAMTGLVGGLGTMFRAVQLASEAEQMTVAFGTMLQSAEAGKELVQDLVKFAAQTPLSLSDTQQASKILLQFGVAGNDVVKTLGMLGDVAGGDAQRFLQMSLAFGQMSAAGKLMGQDLLQMINAGFNPLQEMSRKTGKTIAFLKDEMEKGRITTDKVVEAFKSATSAGGRYFNLMAEQSKTLGGLFSTMKDDIDGALREIGAGIAENLSLKEVMKTISTAAQTVGKEVKEIPGPVKEVGGALAILAGVIGVLSLALSVLKPIIGFLAPGFIKLIAPIMAVVGWFKALGLGLGLVVATVALAKLAALIGVAIALGVALGKLWGWATGLSEAQEEFNRQLEKSGTLTSMWLEKYAKGTKKIVEEGEAIVSQQSRKMFFTDELKKAETELSGVRNNAKAAQERVDELNDSWAHFLNPQEAMTGRPELTARNQELAEAEARLNEVKERVKALQAELKKLEESSALKKLKTDAEKLEEKLQLAIRGIGMTSGQQGILKIRVDAEKAGLSSKQIAIIVRQAEALMRMEEAGKAAAKSQKELKESTDNLIKSLEEELNTFGMSADEKKLYLLKQKGLSEENERVIKGMMEMNKWQEKDKKQTEEAAKITQEYLTPLEKFGKRVELLNQLFDAGKISEGTFGRAMEDAEDDLDKIGKSAKDAAGEMGRFDAATVGSAEALQRLQEYRDRIAFKRPEGTGVSGPLGSPGNPIAMPAPTEVPGPPPVKVEAVVSQDEVKKKYDEGLAMFRQVVEYLRGQSRQAGVPVTAANFRG